ncbi:MAG: gliding motility-associated C-terminal domain-containing protein, partial [Flavobacteriales bacterium]|nr:gliding motility-associated C-terminal domain-containing protein [Flavobacteriales bacterium]
TATDPDGCSGTGFVTVSEPVVIPDKFDLTCDSAGCDGSASVVPTGGTSPYSYQWLDINNIPIPGETSSSTDSLCAGAWCVEVTDDAGCKDTTCVTIVLPAFTITPTLTSCVGYCDGIATLTELGGVAPFTYQWQNPLGIPLAGETDSILDSLCSGMYYLQVLTGNACTLVDSIQVSDPLTVDVNIATFKDACFGVCDGSATTTTSGGSSPYSYTWDDPNAQTTPVATGLCAGIYSVLVTDANSCGPDTAFVTIGQNGEITTTTSVIHTNCDTVNGLATAVVSGGSTPYTYAWNNPGNSTIAIANGLPAGSYQLVVTDSSQCTDTTIVAVGYVDSNVATLSLTKPISCFGACDGEMDVVITGGVPPYEYAWSTKDTAASVDSLCPDTVSVTATDSSGCPATAVLILVEPPPILATIASTSETSCNSQDGTINVTPTGGTIPYTFTWTQLVSTTSTAFDLVAGTYSVTVEDAQGCPPDTVTAVLAVPPPIVPTTTATPATCFGYDDGTVNATIVSGGAAPYTFGWDVSGTVTETDSTSLNSVVVAGTYTVTVTDINNCPTTTSVSVVTEPGPINITLSSFCVDGEGAISTTTTGGTPGYDYIWSDGSIFSNLSMLQPGTYDVTVTDINNCPPDEKGVVILPCLVEIPTAFTPNNDGENDLWLLKNMEYFGDVTISVYNRWGDRVYNHKGGGSLGGSAAYTPWDGKHKLTGANLPTAVYYYVIENVSSEFLVDGSTLVGFVTIIRP